MKAKKKKGFKIAIICGAVVLVAALALWALSLYGQSQMKKIPGMTFEECLAYTLGGSEDGMITVGVIRDGQASYTVYGKDGKELPNEPHTYEIGSLTKTFTAALIQKAIEENLIRLDGTLDQYLSLPQRNAYPTIRELLTHTSGLKGYYFELPMIGNFLAGRNDFCGITDKMVLDKLASLNIGAAEHPFEYSNYGYALLGLVLESVYGTDYTALVNRFAAELGLSSTHIASGDGDLGNYWDWREGDAYLSAGALTSDIGDMLRYAQLQLDGSGVFGECHRVVREINATTESNRMMDIHMDSIGMAWMTDAQNGIVWHNGGTGHYNCYLGFRPETGAAVVILSNLAPNYRIPATVMGVKLLTQE